MSERRQLWEYIFIETRVFVQDQGTISETDRERLYFDLTQGGGEHIPDTGGLKRIRCGLGGHLGTSKSGWEVVFADYPYSDKRKRVFVLVDKCRLTRHRTLNEEQKKELRRFKARLDQLMGDYYEEL